ncbi:LuxR C-terminal-related transcriptional regulator [Gynurincola endophyticus]|uniref:LuxR C-terminal-related transcriptional regulator n=1 Tax=Gynurincola endophyticus TaxID=2479004 RepID=UPI000F8CC889|nr:LuxR C-terminal-related transcriptional regulator [Gynurincola endophyticus]
MEVISFDQAKEIWKRVIKSSDNNTFVFELEIHKRLLELFHVGPHYYYIFNCGTAEFELLDEKAETIVGYKKEILSPRFIFTKIHPEDLAHVLNNEDTITEFYTQLPLEKMLSYKTSYDYRIMNAEGKYIRLLQQVTAIQVDDNGSVFRTLGVHTDITNIKQEGKPVLNFYGLNGEPSYYDVKSKKSFEPQKPLLTRREQEIVKLIMDGYNTEEISATLFLSPNTVKTHRRNIMSKTKTGSPAELVKLAILKGWV